MSLTGTIASGGGSTAVGAGGTGDVVGPDAATATAIARYDNTSGKLIKDSVVTISDTGDIEGAISLDLGIAGITVSGEGTGFTRLQVDNLRLDGNTVTSLDVNGNITLTPNGTGQVLITDGGMSKPSLSLTSASTPAGIGKTPAGFGLIHGPSVYTDMRGNALVLRDGSHSPGFAVGGATPSATSPSVLPAALDDTTTGLGFAGTGLLSIIAGGVEVSRGASGVSGNSNGLHALRVVESNAAVAASPNLLVVQECRKLLTNEGAMAENYHALPGAVTGQDFEFYSIDSDGLRVVASAGDEIEIGGVVSAVAGFIRLQLNASVRLIAVNATRWKASASTGTITVDS